MFCSVYVKWLFVLFNFWKILKWFGMENRQNWEKLSKIFGKLESFWNFKLSFSIIFIVIFYHQCYNNFPSCKLTFCRNKLVCFIPANIYALCGKHSGTRITCLPANVRLGWNCWQDFFSSFIPNTRGYTQTGERES